MIKLKYRKNQKMSWQYALANNIFFDEEDNDMFSSKKMNGNFYELKRKKLPMYLYKFYSPTIENISDVQNRLLWLASPDTFNDPYDCKLFFDISSFEQYYTIRSFKNNLIFSEEEKNIIYKTLNTKPHSYFESFPYKFRQIVENSNNEAILAFQKELWTNTSNINKYIKGLISDKYRIACFSAYMWNSKEYEQLMWAHYAQSHRGFCVEYDISPLFNDKIMDKDLFNIYSLGKANEYLLPSKQRTIMMNGFFPVHYSSKRIELSKTLCYAISKNLCNKKQRCDINIKVFRSIVTKTLPWKYEQEWRLIVDSKISHKVNHKIPFPFAKRIIVGVKASDELLRILSDTASLLNIKIEKEYI